VKRQPIRTAAYILALIAPLLPTANHVALGIAALSPYLTAGAAIATVLLLLTRRWFPATAAIALTAAVIATQLALFIGTNPPDGATFRVLTSNVLMDQADPKALQDIAKRNADVVILEELTPELADDLNQSGIQNAFPYQTLEPASTALAWASGVASPSHTPSASRATASR